MRVGAVLSFMVAFAVSCAYAWPANVTEIILGYGYPCEQHFATTPDGYVLSIQRIPHGKTSQSSTKGVVFYQHGLTDASVGICMNDPEESLPFILADAGYDVWLGNNRGNGYSMTNIYYTPDQDEFWDFSWDEMAQYDLPTHINYVLQQTGKSQLSYIGHSEGTIQAFAGFLDPTVAAKVNLYMAMAPVAYVSHTESVVVKALADLDTDEVFELLGLQEFALPNVLTKLLPGVCNLFPTLCDFDIELIMGPTTFLNESRISYYANYEPNPTSVKNMAHWAQQVRDATFCKFDYGTTGNMQHYNQPTPPCYDLTKFPASLPTVLFTGGEDYLADPTDVAILMGLIPPPYVHNEPEYAHADFILGTNAYQRIYPLVLEFLEKYN